ncbi:MAG: hypothetical protein ACLQU3_25940 [Limisphaerales bacterium]
MKFVRLTLSKLVKLPIEIPGAALATFFAWVAAAIWVLSPASTQAQTGPFSPSDWPPTINTSATVDYVIIDPNAVFTTPAGWNADLILAGGGDQAYSGITLDGLFGDQLTSDNLNIADPNYTMFVDVPVIDILLQVYGNSSLYNADGSGKGVGILEGQLNYLTTPSAGTVPLGANNGVWNWMLLSVTNPVDPATTFRYVGDTSYPEQIGGTYGGVNGGTLRLQGIGAGLTIRAIALGPQGVFGTSNQINVFTAAAACPQEPPVNLTYVDFNQGVTNYLTVINDANLGETFSLASGVGPAGDLRTAIFSTSGLMNFGVLSNYLGLPCNTPRTMKLGLEVYDDPNLVGTQIMPSQFATDSQGDLGSYAGSAYTLTGTGKWLKLGFWIPGVDLVGVGTAPLTGGPTLSFVNGSPYIDRIELGIIRAGTNVLAGLDPEPDYYMNPLICTTNYGYYAEWDPHDGITNNVTTGSSGGDQNMVVEMAGPPDDQRLAEAPAPGSGNNNIQFALENNVFGPSLQDNANVSIQITYYDDPNLAGAQIGLNAYDSYVNGIATIIGAPPAPYNARAVLQGTGKWVDAFFYLPNVNFIGVNQGPQSVCRLETSPAVATNLDTGDVFVSRIRYDVIRPCGPFEGINMLQSVSIQPTNKPATVSWFGTATLQSATNVVGPYTSIMSVTNILTNSYTAPGTYPWQFFRLQYPAYPAYLLTP